MAGNPKATDKEKQKAVDNFRVGDETVKQIAKRLRVSTPAVYQWISQDTKDRAEAELTGHLSPSQIQQHERLTCMAQLDLANKKILELERTIARMSVELYGRG